MATPLENLQTAYANVAQQIADITASQKPSYSKDGQSFSRAEYLRMLLDEQKTILAAIQMAEGPYEIVTLARGG